jgi:hypothetical protein
LHAPGEDIAASKMPKKWLIVPGLTLPASISCRANFDALLNLEGFPMCEVIFCIASSICVSEASTVVLNRRRLSGTVRKHENEFAYLFLQQEIVEKRPYRHFIYQYRNKE